MKQIIERLKTVDRDTILHGFLLVLFGAVLIYGFYLDNHKNNVSADTDEFKAGREYETFNASSTINDLYLWSPEERNNLLFSADMVGDFRVVVNATNDGIRNHKELIWDDIDFWIHRGVALVLLGECGDALETFNHALEIDPKDETAISFIAAIKNGSCGADDEILRMREEFNKNTRK